MNLITTTLYLFTQVAMLVLVRVLSQHLRTMGATWRPGEDTDTMLLHCCGRTERNSRFGGSLDVIHGCKLRSLYNTPKSSWVVGR